MTVTPSLHSRGPPLASRLRLPKKRRRGDAPQGGSGCVGVWLVSGGRFESPLEHARKDSRFFIEGKRWIMMDDFYNLGPESFDSVKINSLCKHNQPVGARHPWSNRLSGRVSASCAHSTRPYRGWFLELWVVGGSWWILRNLSRSIAFWGFEKSRVYRYRAKVFMFAHQTGSGMELAPLTGSFFKSSFQPTGPVYFSQKQEDWSDQTTLPTVLQPVVLQELRDQQSKSSSECPGDVISFGRRARGRVCSDRQLVGSQMTQFPMEISDTFWGSVRRGGCFGPPSKCPGAIRLEWPVGQCQNQVEHSATSSPRTGGWRLGWCRCASWTGWCGISRSCRSCQEWKTSWSELPQPLLKFWSYSSHQWSCDLFHLKDALIFTYFYHLAGQLTGESPWFTISSSVFFRLRSKASWRRRTSGTGRVDATEALEVGRLPEPTSRWLNSGIYIN